MSRSPRVRRKGTGACRIEVIDDGIGISAEAIPRLFDRFYQEDNSRTRRHGGMGMGLALVRRLCDAHAATVKAHSDENGRQHVHDPLAACRCGARSRHPPT